ncbi:MAG: nicotinamide mononucleotide transporter [Firmicutes bacterium]|nr:nicotinamide mononucleotide transporter [Bacillota bacterium]
MRIFKAFRTFTKFEWALWLISLAAIIGSFLWAGSNELMKVIASCIGVTSLIFIAKGHIFGQILMIAFSVLYGIISFHFRYYGEMITYMVLCVPIAVIALYTWIKHTGEGSSEVEVAELSARQRFTVAVLTIAITIIFYFLLKWLDTANLIVSTVSIATSFLAAYLEVYRSAYYAVGYILNDIVLIVLWLLATIEDISYLPMMICFIMFLFNDIYGFVNWQRMKKRQAIAKTE